MKKIILIGSEGVLGKHYSLKLQSTASFLALGDIRIKKQFINNRIIKKNLDLKSEKNIERFFIDIKKKFGKFDILINNGALTTEGMKKMKTKKSNKDEFNVDNWKKTLDINLTGTFLSIKYFLKHHLNKDVTQKIINIGSIYGVVSPHHEIYKNQNFSSSIGYTASKSGLIGMTKWLSTKYSSKRVICNIISPSGVYNNQKKNFLKDYEKLLPYKRMAKPDEIYGALKFLISEESNYVTGQNIIVDGGFSAW
tara:strand:+ start:1726 stop:2481 length:756 start_codon:yes stop_codon:yes gene_type:complete